MSYIVIHALLVVGVIVLCMMKKLSNLIKAVIVIACSVFILLTNNYFYMANHIYQNLESDFKTLELENKDLFVDFYFFDSYIWPIANEETVYSSTKLDLLDDYFFFMLEDRYLLEYDYRMFIQVGYTEEDKTMYCSFEPKGDTKDIYTPNHLKVTKGLGFYEEERIYSFMLGDKYVKVDLFISDYPEDIDEVVLKWIDDIYELNL